jgi:hypothetical protein
MRAEATTGREVMNSAESAQHENLLSAMRSRGAREDTLQVLLDTERKRTKILTKALEAISAQSVTGSHYKHARDALKKAKDLGL